MDCYDDDARPGLEESFVNGFKPCGFYWTECRGMQEFDECRNVCSVVGTVALWC